ncbi:MAG: hypothetical protein NTX33_12115 [Propionibacteriales bacterium]|nr:hypothetical protein [Propionibacteriales bacterium]
MFITPTARRTSALLATAACVAGLSTSLTTPAHASGGDDGRVIRTGSCSGSADWKLKVKSDDGRLEVEGEIDSNRRGQEWRWSIVHNGSVSARGTAVTRGPSGSFSIERRIVNLAGTDHVVFRAVRGSQVCRGVVNY